MDNLLAISGALLLIAFIYLAFNFSVLFNMSKRYFFTLLAGVDAWMCLSYENFWPVLAVVFMGLGVGFYYVFYRIEANKQDKELQTNE